jgi:8-oxo-dGTP diphosphatase
MKQAVAAIIVNEEDQILLIKISGNSINHAHKWENAGGKVDGEETVEEAVIREVGEELGVEYMIDEVLFTQDDENFKVTVFTGTINQEPMLKEVGKHSQIGWFDKEELKDLELASYTKDDFKRLGWV